MLHDMLGQKSKNIYNSNNNCIYQLNKYNIYEHIWNHNSIDPLLQHQFLVLLLFSYLSKLVYTLLLSGPFFYSHGFRCFGFEIFDHGLHVSYCWIRHVLLFLTCFWWYLRVCCNVPHRPQTNITNSI